VLPVADRRELTELARGKDQRDSRVSEPERGELPQLGAEIERQLAARDDGVDLRDRAQVVVGQLAVGMSSERVGKGVHVLRSDREAGRRAMAAEALEMLGASRQSAVQVEDARRAT
jgi:hypothetical protein